MPVDEQLKTEDLRETSTFGESVSFYYNYYKPYRGKLAWAVFWHLIEMVPQMAFPILTMFVVDYLIPARNTLGVFSCLGVVVGLLAVNALFFTAYRTLFIQVVVDATRDLRNQVVRRLQILSLEYHNRHHTGRYYSKIITDVEKCQEFANVFMQQVVSFVILMSIAVTVLGFVHWKILLVLLGLLPVFQGVRWVFRMRMRMSRKNQRLAREKMSAVVSNFLQASLLARMHGHEGYEKEKVDSSNVVMNRKTIDADADAALFSVVNTATTTFFNFLVLAFAAWAVIEKELTFGEMLLFNGYAFRVVNMMQQLLQLYPKVAVFCESITSIQEILEAPDLEFNQGKEKVEFLEGRISFDRVSFTYEKAKSPVLKEVSIDIPAGTTVGLVGKSGSGKSTFVNLTLGLYRTREGVVSLDQRPVDTLDMRSARHHIGVVSQDPILFSGSVYDNIVHAYSNTPMESVIEASRKANAHEFICKLPEGYASDVGESGTLLSGGQKQRIALARTIMRNPSILVLDEATSALDSESEKMVQDAIDRLSQQMTTLIIAHRLSTIRNADLILVFKEGEIVEQGTHEELIELHGEYANLLMYQSFGEVPEGETAAKA